MIDYDLPWKPTPPRAAPGPHPPYRINPWAEADTYVEVWTESRSIAGVVEPTCRNYATTHWVKMLQRLKEVPAPFRPLSGALAPHLPPCVAGPCPAPGVPSGPVEGDLAPLAQPGAPAPARYVSS